MSQPSLVARLGLTTEEFDTRLNASQSNLKRLQQEAKVTAAQIALLEQTMARGGGTAAQMAEHRQLQQTLRGTQSQARATAQQLEALNAVGGTGTGGGLAFNQNGKRLRKGVMGMEGLLLGAAGSDDPAGTAMGMASMLPMVFQMSLPTMLAVGGSVMLAKSIHGAVEEASKLKAELKSAMDEASAAGSGFQSKEGLTHNLETLTKAINDATKAKGMLESVGANLADYGKAAWRTVTNGGDWKGAQESVAKDDSQPVDDAVQKRLDLGTELVKLKKEQDSLDEKAHREGEDAVASERELLGYREQVAQIKVDENLDPTTRAQMIDQLRVELSLRTQIRDTETKKHEIDRDAKLTDVWNDHPEMRGASEGNEFLTVNPNASHPRAINKLLAARDRVISQEENVKAHGGDTTDAHLASLEAEGKLRDGLDTEAMKTPEERQAEAQRDNRRLYADAQMDNLDRRGRDTDTANDADSSFSNFFHPNTGATVPALPDRTPDIDASHANAGKSDVPAASVDNQGIIGAINNPEWVGKFGLKNK